MVLKKRYFFRCSGHTSRFLCIAIDFAETARSDLCTTGYSPFVSSTKSWQHNEPVVDLFLKRAGLIGVSPAYVNEISCKKKTLKLVLIYGKSMKKGMWKQLILSMRMSFCKSFILLTLFIEVGILFFYNKLTNATQYFFLF